MHRRHRWSQLERSTPAWLSWQTDVKELIESQPELFSSGAPSAVRWVVPPRSRHRGSHAYLLMPTAGRMYFFPFTVPSGGGGGGGGGRGGGGGGGGGTPGSTSTGVDRRRFGVLSLLPADHEAAAAEVERLDTWLSRVLQKYLLDLNPPPGLQGRQPAAGARVPLKGAVIEPMGMTIIAQDMIAIGETTSFCSTPLCRQ